MSTTTPDTPERTIQDDLDDLAENIRQRSEGLERLAKRRGQQTAALDLVAETLDVTLSSLSGVVRKLNGMNLVPETDIGTAVEGELKPMRDQLAKLRDRVARLEAQPFTLPGAPRPVALTLGQSLQHGAAGGGSVTETMIQLAEDAGTPPAVLAKMRDSLRR